MRGLLVAVAATTLLVTQLGAEDIPWDYSSGPSSADLEEPTQDLFVDIVDGLIAEYRDNKVTTTVSRCLFHVSCSHFAERAFNEYGPVGGSIVFIDRYFYRENSSARGLYALVADEFGINKVNDDFFVP